MKLGSKVTLVTVGLIVGGFLVWIFKDQSVLQLVNGRTIHNHDGNTSASSFALRGPLKTVLD